MSPKKRPDPPANVPEQPAPAPAPSGAPEIAGVPPAENRLESDLHRIYDEAGGAKTDMTRLEQVRHSTIKKILVGLMVFFAVLAGISWAGFFLFSPEDAKFSGEGVSVVIEGPAEAKSGELVTYAVRYKNGERVPLGTSGLELRLPKAFKMQTSDPASVDTTWKIGSIAPGKEGMVTVTGVFLAPIDKELDMQAILTYRPADFNSEFQKVSTRTVRLTDSVIGLEVTGPAKVLPGDKVTLTFKWKNGSDNAFEQLRVRAVFPDKFIPERSEPASVDGEFKEWDVASLAPQGEGSLTVTGSFASEAEGAFEVAGQVGFLGADEQFELQKETKFGLDVLRGDLVTALILNGKAESQPLRFGDVLRFAVTYRNTGTVTLEDVTLSAVFETVPDGKILVWNSLKDKARGLREAQRITWTKRQVPSLGRIEAGEEGTLDFELPVLAEPIAGLADPNYQVTAWLEATVSRIDGAEVSRTTKTPPIVGKIVSNTALAAEARYFNEDGIPVGTGPLPPKVGEATTYRVTWKVSNSLHELTDLRLSAKLPSNVRWTGASSVDAGDLRFDAAAEKMVWTLNWMPTTIKTLTVSFDVAITPTPDQKDRVPTLVDATIFEAVDKATGWPILLSQPPMTTALENDDAASGKGRVQ